MTDQSTLARRSIKGETSRPLDHPYFDLIRLERRQNEDEIRRHDAEQPKGIAA